MGIKDFVPPYLDPSLSLDELMTGVSFASGSSGFDPLTAQLVVRLSYLFISYNKTSDIIKIFIIARSEISMEGY